MVYTKAAGWSSLKNTKAQDSILPLHFSPWVCLTQPVWSFFNKELWLLLYVKLWNTLIVSLDEGWATGPLCPGLNPAADPFLMTVPSILPRNKHTSCQRKITFLRLSFLPCADYICQSSQHKCAPTYSSSPYLQCWVRKNPKNSKGLQLSLWWHLTALA